MSFISPKPGVARGFLQNTRSGFSVDVLNFDISEYCAEDMLVSLSRAARFNGHTTEFYSVAQHSVIASHIGEMRGGLQLARVMLLHDSEEYLTGDMIAPIKALFPEFSAIAERIRAKIMAHHGLPEVLCAEAHKIDKELCASEMRDLQPLSPICPSLPEPLFDVFVNPQGPRKALAGAVARYRELFPEMPMLL